MSEAPVKEFYRGRADGVRGDDGAWPIKRRQEGTRQRLYPLDKAAAHALRAAAAYTALPRATAASRQQPLLRDYRRPRRAAARAGPLAKRR